MISKKQPSPGRRTAAWSLPLPERADFSLFCVGDDWAGINRFAGGDIGFILDFEKYWGPSEVCLLETVYRTPQQLLDIAGAESVV